MPLTFLNWSMQRSASQDPAMPAMSRKSRTCDATVTRATILRLGVWAGRSLSRRRFILESPGSPPRAREAVRRALSRRGCVDELASEARGFCLNVQPRVAADPHECARASRDGRQKTRDVAAAARCNPKAAPLHAARHHRRRAAASKPLASRAARSVHGRGRVGGAAAAAAGRRLLVGRGGGHSSAPGRRARRAGSGAGFERRRDVRAMFGEEHEAAAEGSSEGLRSIRMAPEPPPAAGLRGRESSGRGRKAAPAPETRVARDVQARPGAVENAAAAASAHADGAAAAAAASGRII
mmetsp:Transcript_12422/g.38243  ORF Transcript_12422/g.38243 Transcript_12422/m.38243 type:complete len:296 (+) Transcript_12422:1087-1974(+)